MEPIKIEVEVKLSEQTLEVMKRCVIAVTSAIIARNIPTDIDKEEGLEIGKQVIADAASPVERGQKAPEQEQKPAEAEAPDDMPDFEAEEANAPVKEVSDDEMAAATRAVVKKLKALKKSPTVIKTSIYPQFGIERAVDCPKDRRPELIAALNKLVEE